jgi:DNA-binding CsgD family transcriptional regulator
MIDQLERSELLRLIELASQCLTATTDEQLETIISSIYDLASYGKAALCALSRTGNEVALTHYVNHSYGARWAELYASQNFHRIDPILIHASTTDGVFRWDETRAPPMCREDSADFLEAAEAFGLANGVSFSCAGVSRTFRSVLSFTGVPAHEFERTRRVLTVIAPHLHESYRRVLHCQLDHDNAVELSARPVELSARPVELSARPVELSARPVELSARGPVELSARAPVEFSARAPVEFSAREREVLCWAQQGKTYWEIGCILGISQRTVKFHFARIKAKLDVVSTAHAIAKAMRTGLIT